MSETMKAANLYAPADVRVEQVPIPKPGPSEVLIKVKACGVCGSDISRLMKTGTYHFPTIPGHEFTGTAFALGAEVDGVDIGQRVTVVPFIPCHACDYCAIGEYQLCENYGYLGSRTDGAYAEYVVAPAENILSLPDGVSFELGAMTDPASVALHAVKKLGIQAGDSVAVFGVGPIGAFALQWAKILGAAYAVAVDIFSEKLDIARELGAEVAINGREQDPVEQIMQLTGGRGVNRTIEFAGNRVTQEQSLLATAKLGAIVWGGISHSGLTLAEKTVDCILRRELTLVGSWNSSAAPLISDWEKSVMFMERGQLAGKSLVSHKLSLDELPAAFEMMLARQEYFNKVMFFPEL